MQTVGEFEVALALLPAGVGDAARRHWRSGRRDEAAEVVRVADRYVGRIVTYGPDTGYVAMENAARRVVAILRAAARGNRFAEWLTVDGGWHAAEMSPELKWHTLGLITEEMEVHMDRSSSLAVWRKYVGEGV